MGTQLKAIPHQIALQGLVIGVTNQKIHVLDAFLKHVIDGVSSGSTDADHFDNGTGVGSQTELKIAEWRHKKIED